MTSQKHEAQVKLDELLASLPPDTPDNVNLREELLQGARKLLLSLERQDNVVERVCFQIWETIAIHVAIDLGIFELMKAKSPRTADDIAASVKADPTLTHRILRCLGSYGALQENADGTYSSTKVCETFADPIHQNAMVALYDFLTPGWVAVPDFLKETGYQNPTSGTKTAFAKAYGKPEGATVWEILLKSPYMDNLNKYMAHHNDGHRNWMDVYPVEERLGKGAKTDPQAVMMVDAGGGHGHQAIGLKKRFPNLPGRYVVEDLPQGLPAEQSVDVEFLAHDLTTEQPIKGARCYYLRYVIHDWSQDWCAQMLSQIRKAMEPGYSKVLINEWVVPERGATRFMTSQDLDMMSFGGGMERTLELHREYVERAGLKISGVWSPNDKISESVLELELA